MLHPLRPPRRALAAACGLLALCLAVAAPASPARAANGTYTAMLCANPDTGQGTTDADGVFPPGVTMATDHINMSTLQSRQMCSGTVHGGRGMVIATNGGYLLEQLKGTRFTYTLPSDLDFRGATIYARTNTTNGLIAQVVRSASDWVYASPSAYACEAPGWNCLGTGSAANPFGAGNRIDVGPAHDNMPHGFKWFLRCTWHGCNVTDANVFQVYGGKVLVGDESAPHGAPGGGGLATDATLKGTEELSFSAGDGESGVYRARLLVDGHPEPWSVVDAGRASCRDVNLGNADPYEFPTHKPCPTQASGVASLDTRKVADGEHELRLVVENVAGKATTIMQRDVVVDNVAPPKATADPVVKGTPRRGSLLVATPAAFTNGGAAGEPAVARRWERCRRDGTACAPIDGEADTLYEPVAADVGRRLRVVETASNSEGATSAASALTDVVREPDGTLPPPEDGTDNDCDGVVDEPSEPASCPTPTDDTGPKTPTGVDATPVKPSADAKPTPAATTPAGSARSAAPGTPNGDGASPTARLTLVRTRGTVQFGRTLTVAGRLTDAAGRPIRNAIIDVSETAALPGARPAAGRPAVTDGDGRFTYAATGAGGSRALVLAYRYLREGDVVARADVGLTVKARVQFAVKLRDVVASYRGKVLAGAMPRGGKLVIVQGRAKGGRWQTFATRRAGKGGAFKGRYRLKVRRPGRQLQFRVRVLAESGWNYVGVTSRPVTRRVK